ncbi:PilN domain-containing protein [Acidobacteriia bacterium AH_259_A11_L15]|nr:PilN domain-containing protein [Acidobacteriia bacterium AH_259_A11_L15]
MIRINLLGRPRPKVKRAVAITGGLQLVLFAIPVGVAVLALVGHHWIIQLGIDEVNEEIKTTDARLKSLTGVQTKVEQRQKTLDELQNHRDTIAELVQKQSGPHQLLEAVGATVNRTPTLWLIEMRDRGEERIEFKGRAGSMNAISDFISNLQNSGKFTEVEIQEAVEKADREEGVSFEFTLSAKFSPSQRSGQASEGQPQTAAGGGP